MPDRRSTLRRAAPAAALALALTGAAGSAAQASPQFTQTFDLRFVRGADLVRTPSAATGLLTTMSADDPGEPFSMPKRAARLRITLPPGTRLDPSVLDRCTAETLRAGDPSACPPGSRLGGGTGSVRTGLAPPGTPGGGFTEAVHLFNADRGMVLLFSGPVPVVLPVALRGRTLDMTIPRAPVALSHLELRIGVHTEGRRRYAVTPPRCPRSGSWTTTARFAYTDGTSATRTSRSACSRRRP
jgi:hypothetical protein